MVRRNTGRGILPRLKLREEDHVADAFPGRSASSPDGQLLRAQRGELELLHCSISESNG